jgi:hypothetical protein
MEQKQKFIDKISYEAYCNDTNNFFGDELVPSLIYKIFMSNSNEISPDSVQRCQENINKLYDIIKSNGYSDDTINNVLEYFPIFASDKLDLLGEYITNTPFCMFLDKVESNPYELVIKLDGTSTNQDLNVFGGLLKEPYGFKNLILVYDYNPYVQINFLKLKYIYDVSQNIFVYPNDVNWLEYVQLSLTELFMALTIYHALWHLMTAHITCVIKENVNNKDIVELFTMNEQNIFLKAIEVKTFFLESPLLFGTILYRNKFFMEYAANWVNNFIDTFDIETHYEKYILRNVLNPNQLWMVGFKENLNLVKNLSKTIINKTDQKNYNVRTWCWNGYQNINMSDKLIKLSTLIELNYVLGGVYHSYTFEYQKIGFTDILYCKKIPQNFYTILLSTLDWDNDFPIYSDYHTKINNKYIPELEEFKNNIQKNRLDLYQIVKQNHIYRSYIYTPIEIFKKHYSINTPNTRV